MMIGELSMTLQDTLSPSPGTASNSTRLVTPAEPNSKLQRQSRQQLLQ